MKFMKKSMLQIKGMTSSQRSCTNLIKATPTFGTNSFRNFWTMKRKLANWKRSLMSCLMQKPSDNKRFICVWSYDSASSWDEAKRARRSEKWQSSVLTPGPCCHRANPAGVVTTTPFKNAAVIGNESSVLCDECGAIPTQCKCRKCKERYVCDICCSTKRGLELAWWCATCFGNESVVASQELIRSGDYDSDTDHDCLRVLDPLSWGDNPSSSLFFIQASWRTIRHHQS